MVTDREDPCRQILQEVTAKSPPDLDHDPSTNQLIRLVREMRKRE